MKLNKRNTLFISFMLFSMFFGAGNLIFPPFLGQNAGSQTLPALLGFLATGVVLPVLGVVVISQADGLNKLTDRVGKTFTTIFTLLIFLSIGPGLAIPRAASVPFEMAVAPYLPEGSNLKLFMLGYSLIFFLLAAWLSLNPNKLVERMGSVLTPILLLLMVVLFAAFLIGGKNQAAPAQGAYADSPFLTGFREGYLTMDTIAALNFGVVIAATLRSYGISSNRSIISYTLKTGALAGGLRRGDCRHLTQLRHFQQPLHYFLHPENRCSGRRTSGGGLHHAGLYGLRQLRGLSAAGQRCLDPSVHCGSTLWGGRCHSPGIYFHPGLPYHLCGTDYLIV